MNIENKNCIKCGGNDTIVEFQSDCNNLDFKCIDCVPDDNGSKKIRKNYSKKIRKNYEPNFQKKIKPGPPKNKKPVLRTNQYRVIKIDNILKNFKEKIALPIIYEIINKAINYCDLDPNMLFTNRSWLRKDNNSNNSKKSLKIRFMSYNILADGLIKNDAYFNIEKKYLDNKNRMETIIERDILSQNPDIINLQEVQPENEDLIENLVILGYSYNYKKRLEPRVDGLLTAFKKDKFELVYFYTMHFYYPDLSPLLDRQNIATFTILKDITKQPDTLKELFLVVNTHIQYNNKRGDIKVTQILLIIKAIKFLQCCFYNNNLHVIFSGDLNTAPKSPIYQMLAFSEFKWFSSYKSYWSGQLLANNNLYKEFFKNEESDDPRKTFKWLNNHYFSKYNDNYDSSDVWELIEDLVEQFINQDGEILLLEKKNTKQQHGNYKQHCNKDNHIYSIRNMLKEIGFKSAYGDCLRSAAFSKNNQYKIIDNYFIHDNRHTSWEPFMTSCGEFPHMITVDYIFFSSILTNRKESYKRMRCTDIFQIPNVEFYDYMKYLPNKFLPSDHLPLCCDFEINLSTNY